MRRWRALNQLWQDRNLPSRDQVVLAVEQLEAREVLTPVVLAPEFESVPTILEGDTRTFSSANGDSFRVIDFDESAGLHNVVATLSSANGTFIIDEDAANVFGVTPTVSASGVALAGRIDLVNNFLQQSGFTFAPTPFYSGEADVTLSVVDQDAPGSDTGSITLLVRPVASPVTLAWAATDEVRVRSEPFALPVSFLSVSNWGDADGSETFTLGILLDVDDASLIESFTLSANGVALVPLEPGFWRLEEQTDPDELQAILDSLVLTPPAGFNGRVSLTAFGSLLDEAVYPSFELELSDPAFPEPDAGTVSLRFFEAATFTTPTVVVPEGVGSIDLGGRYAVDDPAELPEDSHSLTISAPRGTLTFDPALVPAGVSVGSDGGTILLAGELAVINAFLATPGSLTFTIDDPAFAGRLELGFKLVNQPGDPMIPSGGSDEPLNPASATVDDGPPPSVAVAVIEYGPVAGIAIPSAADIETDQDTPVALSIDIARPAGDDPTESVLVTLTGVPEGATFDRGSDLGDGQWAFSVADLADLVFTPPPGASGLYTITVSVIVSDSASDLGTTDSVTESASFTVLVRPAALAPDPEADAEADPEPDSDSTTLFLSEDEGEDDDEFDGSFADPIVVTESDGEADADESDEDDEFDREISITTFTGGSIDDTGEGAPQAREPLSQPGPASLFTQPEEPVPSYVAGERHPLPPVLPLDQTLPVAGFSDSGGDSLALIDKLYRDANGPDPQPTEPRAGTAESVRPVAANIAAPARAPVDDAATAAPMVDGANDVDWFPYVAAGAAVGSLAALLARRRVAALTRSLRGIFRTPIRQHTEGAT